jgi:crossover junction endodeoxyribonuclease RuvC
MKCIIGIDPGKSGAIAVLSTDRKIIEVLQMPTTSAAKGVESFNVPELIKILEEYNTDYEIISIFIEKQQVFPDQGSVSGGNLMYGYGLLIGTISALKIPLRIITAKEWNGVLFKGMQPLSSKDHKKERSVSVALSLYPDAAKQLTKRRGRKIDHNMAEALLIAEYGVIQLCAIPQ